MNSKIRAFLLFFSILFLGIFYLSHIDFSEAEERSSVDIDRSQIRQTERHLLEQQSELLSVDIKEKGILGEIERLEKDVAEDRVSLRELSSQIKEISGEVQGGQRRVQQLKQSSLDVRESLKRRLTAFDKFGRPG